MILDVPGIGGKTDFNAAREGVGHQVIEMAWRYVTVQSEQDLTVKAHTDAWIPPLGDIGLRT